MQLANIKVIFFDAAGTLFQVKGSVGESYLRFAANYGITTSPEMVIRVNHAFQEAFRQATPPIFVVDQPEKLKRLERLWWFDIVHAVFYRVGMFEGFDDYFETVFKAFGTGAMWEVYEEVPEVLASLKTQGYELGVISNFDTRFFQIVRDLNLHSYFDTMTISSLAQSAKPSPKIFQYALDQHMVEPEEALHVGDSLIEDVQGATNSGMTGIHLDRQENGKNSSEDRVRTLRELLPLLK